MGGKGCRPRSTAVARSPVTLKQAASCECCRSPPPRLAGATSQPAPTHAAGDAQLPWSAAINDAMTILASRTTTSLLSMIFSFLSVSELDAAMSCDARWRGGQPSCFPPPPPLRQTHAFHTVDLSCNARKEIAHELVARMLNERTAGVAIGPICCSRQQTHLHLRSHEPEFLKLSACPGRQAGSGVCL